MLPPGGSLRVTRRWRSGPARPGDPIMICSGDGSSRQRLTFSHPTVANLAGRLSQAARPLTVAHRLARLLAQLVGFLPAAALCFALQRRSAPPPLRCDLATGLAAPRLSVRSPRFPRPGGGACRWLLSRGLERLLTVRHDSEKVVIIPKKTM